MLPPPKELRVTALGSLSIVLILEGTQSVTNRTYRYRI